MENLFDKALVSKNFIRSKIGNKKIDVAIILGSGLGHIVDVLSEKSVIKYSEIPYFNQSKVKGHDGELIIGKIADKTVLAFNGRIHLYEGYSMKEVTFNVFVMKLLEVDKLIITNSCGGINTMLEPGDLMIIDDFINQMGSNPLIGVNDERFGPRFPDMSEPYSNSLIEMAIEVAKNNSINYKKGCYLGVAGPYYESKSEIKAFKSMGADAVGMSTVPETIVANYLNIECLAIACITNMATGIQKMKHSHQRVVETANLAAKNFSKWLIEIIKNI
ncbi:MAG: purine-nucleoside phosphorylase [Pleomorphochaeta sp.]